MSRHRRFAEAPVTVMHGDTSSDRLLNIPGKEGRMTIGSRIYSAAIDGYLTVSTREAIGTPNERAYASEDGVHVLMGWEPNPEGHTVYFEGFDAQGRGIVHGFADSVTRRVVQIGEEVPDMLNIDMTETGHEPEAVRSDEWGDFCDGSGRAPLDKHGICSGCGARIVVQDGRVVSHDMRVAEGW